MNKEQADTAIQQLTMNTRNPYGALRLMIGAENFVYGKDGVSFRFKMCRKAQFCRVELDEGADLYNLVFIRLRNYELTETGRFEGLYFDQLKDTFERFTGLCLTVPTVIFSH